MTSKKSYNRYFIIFQEEDRGFEIAIDKQPTGYTKIETKGGKCKVTVYAQNLVKGKGPYICYLIDSSKDPAVTARLGEIRLDETGRGETWWEYNEDNIADTGVSVDRFNVAALLVEEKDTLSPLAGYVSKDKVDWKSRISIKTAEKELKQPQPVEEVSEPLDAEALMFKEYEESIKNPEFTQEVETPAMVQEDNTDTGIISEDLPEELELETDDMENIQEVSEEVSEVEYVKIEAEEELRNTEQIEIDEDMLRHKDKKKGSYVKQFHEILEKYEEVKGLTEEMKRCRWWKVPHWNEVSLKDDRLYPYYCAVNHLKMTYPYVNYIKYYRKCGYYYFGIKYDSSGDIKYIIYGIQGGKSPQEQPYMGMTGFVQWVPIKGKDMGMWIMRYNPYTGCIMIPKKDDKC